MPICFGYAHAQMKRGVRAGQLAITLTYRALILGFEHHPTEMPNGGLERHTGIQSSASDRTKEKAPSVHRCTHAILGHTTTLLSQYGRSLKPAPEDSPPENGRGFLLRPIACTGLDFGVSFQSAHRYLRRAILKPEEQCSAGWCYGLPRQP